jgi:hypothetical protein
VSEFDAIKAAIKAYSQPLSFQPRERTKLPDGMLLAIKVAAGDAASIEKAAEGVGHDNASLQDAVSFYLQQQLIGGKANPFQQLGLSPDASPEDIVLHKRWLLKWLHPDRNPNKWQSQMFIGVTTAAQAATAMITSQQPISGLPPASVFHSPQKKTQSKSVSSHNRHSHVHKRKRVRIVDWRQVFWRLARRVALVLVIMPLVYFGAKQFIRDDQSLAINTSNFWFD